MSHLSTQAASIGALQFATLTVAGYDQNLTASGIGGIMGYASKAVHDWDPQFGTRAFFIGSGHSGPTKMLCYDVATNTITELTPPSSQNPATGNAFHTYQHLAINPAKKAVYWRGQNSPVYASVNVEEATPSNIDSAHWTTGIAMPSEVISRCAMEFFPESNDLCILYTADGQSRLFTKNEQTGTTWTASVTMPTAGLGDGNFLLYNPIYKCLLAGFTNTTATATVMYRIDFNVSNRTYSATQLANAPRILYAHGASLPFIDPVSGKMVAFTREPLTDVFIRYYTDELTVTGTGTWNANIAVTVPSNIGAGSSNGQDIFNAVIVPLYAEGVALIFGNANMYIYKHTANSRATDGLTWDDVSTWPGVFGAVPLESSSELHYTWATDQPPLNTAMAGQTYYPGSSANVLAVLQAGGGSNGVPTIPAIDASSPPTGMAGSLKFTYPSSGCGAAPGYYLTNFDGTRGDSTKFIAPDSDLGPIFYERFMLKVSSEMLSQTYRENDGGGAQGNYTATIPAGTSATLTLDNNLALSPTSTYIGRKAVIGWASLSNGSPDWLPNIYTITAVPAINQITLDTRPANANAAFNGLLTIEGNNITRAWKTDINYGNGPNGSSSNKMEVTGNNGTSGSMANKPQMYGQSGNDPYTANNTVSFTADTWMELRRRVEIRGTSDDTTSRVQAWLDNVEYLDHATARVNWSGNDGDGFWQSQHTSYLTRKDGGQTFATNAYMWQGGLVFSSQPIPMVSTTGSPPPPPPPPPDPPPDSTPRIYPWLGRRGS